MAVNLKFLFHFFFIPFILIAQPRDIKFEHLSVDHGLSNNIVYRIIQDSRGFMWFGTEDGLNKYDGYKFTVYRHDPDDSLSISGNWIHEILESHYAGKHVLWIGTHSGLNRFDLETEQFTHFINDPNDRQSLSDNWIEDIYEDSLGDLWIGTEGGLNKYDRETKKFIHYLHDPENPNSLSHRYCLKIYESITAGKSILWIGTFRGLNKFDRKTGKITRYKHDPYNLNSLSYNIVADLYADTSGILWISTNNGGLNKFDIETEQFTRFQYDQNNSNSISSNMVSSILQDKYLGQEVLWLATFNGLNKLDLETEQLTHYKHNPGDPKSLCNNRLTSLFKDKTGSIWIGTFGGGLSKFDPGRQNFTHLKQKKGNLNSLSHNVVCAIIESKFYGPNVFWIGTQDGGLNKYDRTNGNFTHYRHDPENTNSLSNDFVITLYESHFQDRHELWIGTLDGLDKLDLITNKFTRYRHNPSDPLSIRNNIIRSIWEDKTGILWIGTRNGGINKFDRSSGKFLQKRYYIGETVAFLEDNTGTLWAGTHRGLARYNSDSQDFTHFIHDPDDVHSLSHSNVQSIYEDKSFRLWIGTKDGINLFNRETNQFTRYKVKDGLPNNVINGILEDNSGNLWLSTNHGLSKFNPGKNIFRNYDIYDGLQSHQFVIGASCLSTKSEMLFGGAKGCDIFHPDSIKDNLHIPDVYLTDFQIFNKSVEINTSEAGIRDGNHYLPEHISNISEIMLSYTANVFSFEFAALDYHSPQKNQYAYRMDGVDPDWVYSDASRRFATYTELDPGEYVFRVKGSNNAGLWNEEGSSIKIIITPPWWKTNWAYALYIFLFVLTLYALRTYDQKRQRLKYELDLEHAHAEKLEEVDRLKSRFFANISHEFRTPLTLILGPVKQMLSGDFAGNVKEQYGLIIRNGERLLQLINQLLDLSKLESGRMALKITKTDICEFLKVIVCSFSSLAESKTITLKFNPTDELNIGYIDRDKMEKIITNLLSNAFKFTPERGIIGVTVKIPNAKIQSPNKFQVPNSDFVQITVTNTGSQIPQEQLENIFDRFYQVDTTYKKDDEGTGIGLALTKELVELHHGTIEVDCRRGTMHRAPTTDDSFHTTFTIMLPIGKEHLSNDEIIEGSSSDVSDHTPQISHPTSHIPDPGSRIPDKSGSPLRSDPHRESSIQHPVYSILIVEDNPDVTTYICSFLKQDYEIITAGNGKEGLELTMKEFPDLIISDVMMPEMDGFELCQKLKSDERTSHIPIILLTAKADLNSRIEGLEFGADDYISKPFEARELQVRTKNLIEQRQKLREKFSQSIEIKPGEVTATSLDEQFITRLLDVFEDHVAESDFSTEDFAREVGMSRSNLHRKLQALTNQPTHEFLRTLRLKRAAQLLRKSAGSVTDIAYAVGFNNLSHFTKIFHEHFGQTPSNFAKKSDN